MGTFEPGTPSSPTPAKIWMIKYPGKKYVTPDSKITWTDKIRRAFKKFTKADSSCHGTSRFGKNIIRLSGSRRKTIPEGSGTRCTDQTYGSCRRGSWVPPRNSGDEDEPMDKANVRHTGLLFRFFKN